MTKADIAREWRKKHPETPSLKLARMIMASKKDSVAFRDIDDARNRIRYIEGKAGDAMRKVVVKSEFFKEEARPYDPYKLPASDEESFDPFFIRGHKKGLIINDVHLPYQSNEALTACFTHAKKNKPDFILVNGDLLDFHSLSYFQRDPRKKRFSEELDMAKKFFQILDKTFKCKIYFKFGNHEERYDSFLFQKAHELKGVEEFELENIIKARTEGITVIKDKRVVDINGLPVIHGHEFGRSFFSPVNAARGLYLQAKHSCVKGDCHTSSEHTETDITGKIMTAFSIGALCGLTPKWLPLNKWNHGFAEIELGGENEYMFRNYRIYKGKVL